MAAALRRAAVELSGVDAQRRAYARAAAQPPVRFESEVRHGIDRRRAQGRGRVAGASAEVRDVAVELRRAQEFETGERARERDACALRAHPGGEGERGFRGDREGVVGGCGEVACVGGFVGRDRCGPGGEERDHACRRDCCDGGIRAGISYRARAGASRGGVRIRGVAQGAGYRACRGESDRLRLRCGILGWRIRSATTTAAAAAASTGREPETRDADQDDSTEVTSDHGLGSRCSLDGEESTCGRGIAAGSRRHGPLNGPCGVHGSMGCEGSACAYVTKFRGNPGACMSVQSGATRRVAFNTGRAHAWLESGARRSAFIRE
jgi:hypothetical protein